MMGDGAQGGAVPATDRHLAARQARQWRNGGA